MAKKKAGKGKKKPDKNKLAKKSFTRKIKFINKRISEFYEFFGEHSEEYEQIVTLVSTQFGITNLKSADQFILQSQTPINFSTSKTFIDSAYGDPNGIFSEIHQKLKGQTVYKTVREKYSDKLKGIGNVGDFNKKKRKISSLIKSDNVSKLDIMAKNLPSFYDALSQTDSYFQAEYRQKFSEYGHSKDESQAEEIMQEIQRYFQAKMDEGNKIKNGESLFEDEYPFMQEYTPQLYSGNEDDGNEDDKPDWGSAISKLKK